MKFIRGYLTPAVFRRLFICVLGNILLGMGVALTKIAAFGNDPFNGSCMAVSAALHIPYTTYTLLFNAFLFLLEVLFGRRYIGCGTFINWFLLCYVVDFFIPIWEMLLGIPTLFGIRLLVLTGGLLLSGFGLAIYQTINVGISPYDAIPLMLTERFPRIPFFAARIVLDALCTTLILISGGIVGLGTLLTVFGLGPIVQLFTRLLFPQKKASQST